MKLSQRLAIGIVRTKLKVLATISKKKAARSAFRLFSQPQRQKLRPLPPIFKQAANLSITINNQTVRGWRWNQDQGRKVLILHGFESNASKFDRYISPLIKKGYEVLIFDAPAHGRSEGARITAPVYAQTILAINDKFGPIHSYMAHSFGGLALCLALEATNHDPDYRVVLIAPMTETKTAVNSFFKFLKLDDGVRLEFEKIIIRSNGVSTDWFSIRRAMKNINAKVLWIHDEEDETTPLQDALQLKSDQYSNIRFLITNGLGHRRIYRDNQVVKAIIEFL